MKKSLTILLIILSLLGMASFVCAEQSKKDTFYEVLNSKTPEINKAVDYTLKVGDYISINTPGTGGGYPNGYDRFSSNNAKTPLPRDFFNYNDLKWYYMYHNTDEIITDTFEAKNAGMYNLYFKAKKPGQVKIHVHTLYIWYETIHHIYNGKDYPTQEMRTTSGSYDIIVVIVSNPITSLKINEQNVTLTGDETKTLTTTYEPSDANPNLSWSSDTPSVVKVDEKSGKLTPVKGGSATITVTDSETGLSATTKVTVKEVFPSEIVIDKSLSIKTGESKTLPATIKPTNATNKSITWSSDNKSVATVTTNGTVKGIKVGTANITAKTSNGKTATCKVTVNPVLIEKIELNKSSFTLFRGKSYTLTATISPSNATNKTLKWTSSNPSVAKVDSKGLVTSLKVGTTTITCAATDGSGKNATCKVTVIEPVTKITLNKTSISLKKGKTYKIIATITPSNANYKKVTWTSNNKSVATVSSTGIVTALKGGNVTITATAKDGSKIYATCSVKVTELIEKIELNKTTLTLQRNKTFKLIATISQNTATNKKLKWTSSDSKIASVGSTGIVKGIKPGKVTITCTATDGSGVKATCNVIISQLVEKIELNKYDLTLKKGKTFKLIATISPSNATNKKVKWSSDDTSVAKVSSTGIVTAVSSGYATITCAATDGSGVETYCDVYAYVPVTGVELNNNKLEFNLNDLDDYYYYYYTGEYLEATIFPNNADNTNVIWKSSNDNVADVDIDTGEIYVYGLGKTTITVKTEDGKYTDTCDIIVNGVTLNTDYLEFNLNDLEYNDDDYYYTGEYLEATAYPDCITWTSIYPEVADVDSDTGEIYVYGLGETTIYAETDYGSTYCDIVVNGITLNTDYLEFNLNDLEYNDDYYYTGEYLEATVYPDYQDITWESSNPEVADIDSNTGEIYVYGYGYTYITATTSDGSTTECYVEIN